MNESTPIVADGRDIDAYEEYRRIVGEDDNGTLFTPEQYEAYKRKVIPMRYKNRVFVSFTNSNGIDCILAGPQTECFCGHRLIQHQTDFETLPEVRPIPLKCKKCRCVGYHVMPKIGGRIARCHCKHEATDHNVVGRQYEMNFWIDDSPYRCSKPNCKCLGFKTSLHCDCSLQFSDHVMIIESARERHSRGKPIGKPCPYQAMGGITGFTSLSPGIERMDESGAGGLLSQEELDAPITSNDHPFLRSQAQAVYQYKLAQNDIEGAERERPEVESQMRRPGESELDFYERRYQEREKAKYITKPRRRQ